MTVNELVGKISSRIRQLADQKMDELRSSFPETTETQSDLIRHCKQAGYSRGQLIEAIILEEFSREFDCNIEEPE